MMVHYLDSLDYQDKILRKISPILLILLPMCDIIIMGDKLGNKMGDNSQLNNTQSKIFSEIRNNPNITKPQIAQLVGVGKTTVDNAIAVLKQKGYIKRSGSNKTGFWEILNAGE